MSYVKYFNIDRNVPNCLCRMRGNGNQDFIGLMQEQILLPRGLGSNACYYYYYYHCSPQ